VHRQVSSGVICKINKNNQKSFNKNTNNNIKHYSIKVQASLNPTGQMKYLHLQLIGIKLKQKQITSHYSRL